MKTTLDGYEEALIELGKKRDDIIVLSTTKTAKQFAEAHPDRFIKLGMSEQNILGMATGLALEGKTPFASTCTGLGKNWNQLRTICHDSLSVKIADAHETASEDIALARLLPNITVIIPADYHEAKKAVIAAGIMKGPVYIRLAKEKKHVTSEKTSFTIGRVEIMRAGKDCTVVASGGIIHDALQAAEKLAKQEIECTVLDCHTIQPIDKHALISSARITGCMVTAEEHSPKGGLGSAVAEVLSQNSPIPLRMVNGASDAVNRIIRAVKDSVMQRCESVCTEIPEEHGRKLYPELQPELYFRLHGGDIIKSIPGLQKALLNMNEETFSHHCNDHKNDFSSWVRDVFREPVLSRQLEKTRTRLGMALALARWMT